MRYLMSHSDDEETVRYSMSEGKVTALLTLQLQLPLHQKAQPGEKEKKRKRKKKGTVTGVVLTG